MNFFKIVLFVLFGFFVTPLFADEGHPFNIAYVEVNDNKLSNVGCYVRADNGKPFFTTAVIFAANINGVDPNNPYIYFNPQVDALLNHSNEVAELQMKGIKVLLTLLGNHQQAGWSCMTDAEAIQTFANNIVEMVNQYHLDGIDIDDEYSICPTNTTSIIRIAQAIKNNPDFRGKILTKALFIDHAYFTAFVDGHRLAEYLDGGWEMSYFSPAYEKRLGSYLPYGMSKINLAIGVSTNLSNPSAKDAANFIMQKDYGGVMVYNLKNDSLDYLRPIAQAEYGVDLHVLPGCL